jgi:hypothetical protein
VVDVQLTQTTGTAEREAARQMMDDKLAGKRVTLAGDRGYDTRDFVEELRERKITPQVPQVRLFCISGTVRHLVGCGSEARLTGRPLRTPSMTKMYDAAPET